MLPRNTRTLLASHAHLHQKCRQGNYTHLVNGTTAVASPAAPALTCRLWQCKGLRRVNTYLKHFMLDENASFHSAMQALNELRDSVIACHPVLTLLSDTMWGDFVYQTFLIRKG